jgi:alpha-beta hydrolase superfamily lysophospholipase
MVLNQLRKLIARYKQDDYIFPVESVIPCQMRQSETFNNRESIEIEIFETEESQKIGEPTAILRGVLCKAITHGAPTLICAMGQSQNVEEARQFIPVDIFHHLNIVLVNYRGYGVANGTKEEKSRGSTGKPSSKALQDDILRVYDHVKEKFGLSNFYAVGVSLGCAVVTYLSKHRDIKGQLLIAPFDNMVNQACDFLQELLSVNTIDIEEVENILEHPFDSLANMKRNKTPTHVIRAGADTYVKPERTLNLIKHIKYMQNHIMIDHSPHDFDGANPHIRMALRYAIGTIVTKFILDTVEKPKVET